MRASLGMLPWLVVLAIAGAAIWLLLDRQLVVGNWVVAAVLVGHGLVHALYLVPPPSPSTGRAAPRWPFDLARSWLVALMGARRGRQLAAVLIVVVVATSLLAALATVGILPAAWWATLVAVAATVSLLLLVVAFDVQLILGIAIDIVLLAVVATGAWAP